MSVLFSKGVRPPEIFQENVRLKSKIEEMELGQRKSDKTDGGEPWSSGYSHFMKVKVNIDHALTANGKFQS